MKIRILATLVTFSLGIANTILADTKEIPAPLEKIFIPIGFDDNDNVEVILFGEYPNACYKKGRSGYYYDEAKNSIKVWATAIKYDQGGDFCAAGHFPFMHVINLGLIKKGQYRVIYASNTKVHEALEVTTHNTESPDEFLYMPVESVMVIQENSEQENELKASSEKINKLILQGTYPNLYQGCMFLKEIKVSLTSNDIYVVQPIAEINYEGDCTKYQSDNSFRFEVKLPKAKAELSLLHVRVTNGESKNSLIKMHH